MEKFSFGPFPRDEFDASLDQLILLNDLFSISFVCKVSSLNLCTTKFPFGPFPRDKSDASLDQLEKDVKLL